MAISLNELLQPQVILKVISRIKKGQNRLGRWMGFQPTKYNEETASLSGPNTKSGPTRYVDYRIFDWARTVAVARAPATGPAVVAPNPVGDVRITCSRFHMKIPMSYEQLGNLSPIMGPNSQVDTAGQDYVAKQVNHLARRFNNTIELMTSGLLQNSLYFVYSGDNIFPQLAAPSGAQVGFQVDFKVPTTNQGQLANLMGTNAAGGNLILTSWANPAAPVIKNLLAMNAAAAQLSGYVMTDAWVNSLLWYSVITNTEVRSTAGSSNTPFAEYDWVTEKGADGMPTGEMLAVLRGHPTMKWHISDHVLVLNSDIDPSYSTAPAGANIVKMIPDGVGFFLPEPDSDWTEMYQGGEYVVENPGMPGVLRQGYYFWKEYTTQPSGVDLLGLLNAVPVAFVPKVFVAPTLVF